MSNIQSNINRALGTAAVISKIYAHSPEGQAKIKARKDKAKANLPSEKSTTSTTTVKPQASPQKQASQQAMRNMQNEVQSKKVQKDEFANMQTSLGKFSDLPESLQKRIREEYNK